MAAAERFFTKVANDVLEASEKISTRLEEGLSALMAGGAGEGAGGGTGADTGTAGGGNGREEDFEILDDAEDIGMMDGAEMKHGSPLEGIAESVMGDIMKNQAVGPQTPYEHFQAFRSAITWREPFVLSLLAFQVAMFCVCMFVSRKNASLASRLVVMCVIGAVVRGSEYINRFGAMHWQEFATQNYFDERGVFISIMLCAPLLLDSFIMLSMFVKEAGQLLIQVKRTEIQRKQKQTRQQQQQQSDGGGGRSSSSDDSKTKRRAKKEQ